MEYPTPIFFLLQRSIAYILLTQPELLYGGGGSGGGARENIYTAMSGKNMPLGRYSTPVHRKEDGSNPYPAD